MPLQAQKQPFISPGVVPAQQDSQTKFISAHFKQEASAHFKQEATEPDMEQRTGSKLGKVYIKAVYCHPAYLIYMHSTHVKCQTG